MRSMQIDDKYRILLNDDDLPEEIPAEELDEWLSKLKNSVQNICDIL